MDLALHMVGGFLAALYAVRCGVGGRGLVEVAGMIIAFGFVRESWQHAATPPWVWSAHVVNEAGAWGAGAAVVLAHRFAGVRAAAFLPKDWWQLSSQIRRVTSGKLFHTGTPQK
jgi:hypothetical protein